MIEDIQKQILERMRPGYRYARADLIAEDSTDASPSLWKQAMAQLVEVGKVARTGQKRGTRYHLAGFPLLDEDDASPPPPAAPVSTSPPTPAPPEPPSEPRGVPTPGIVMRRPASSDLLSDSDLGLRRRPLPPPADTPAAPRRFQEPAPVHGTGLRPAPQSPPPPTSNPLPAPLPARSVFVNATAASSSAPPPPSSGPLRSVFTYTPPSSADSPPVTTRSAFIPPSRTISAPSAPPPFSPAPPPANVPPGSNPLRNILSTPPPAASPPPPAASPPPPSPTPASPSSPLPALSPSSQQGGQSPSPVRSTTSQSGPVRTVYHHFPSAHQTSEPKKDQPAAAPPLRSVFHNPAMIARELHGPRKNRAAQAAAAAAAAAVAEAALSGASADGAPATGTPSPTPSPSPSPSSTPSHAPNSPHSRPDPQIPPQIQPLLAALGISPSELRHSTHGHPYGLRSVSGGMSLSRPALPPPPPPPPPPPLPPISDEALKVLNAMEPGQNYSRAEVMERAEVNVNEWNKAIKQLLDLSLVEREGERRASAYRRIPIDTDDRRQVWRAPTFWRPPGLIRRALQQQQDAETSPKSRKERQTEFDPPTLLQHLGLPPDARLVTMLAQPELPDMFWRTVVALANSQGGFIVLGVKARWSGTLIVRGLNDVESTRSYLLGQLRKNPKQLTRYTLPSASLRILNCAQRDLILIDVSAASPDQLPVYLGNNSYSPHPDKGTFVMDDSGHITKCSDQEVSDFWASWVAPYALDFPITVEEQSKYQHTIQKLRQMGVLSSLDGDSDMSAFSPPEILAPEPEPEPEPEPPLKKPKKQKASLPTQAPDHQAPLSPAPLPPPPTSTVPNSKPAPSQQLALPLDEPNRPARGRKPKAAAPLPPTEDPILLDIAASARERPKLSSDLMREIVLNLCRHRALGEQDLTVLISRSSATLQRCLIPLLEDGLIQFNLSLNGYAATPKAHALLKP